jgi:hypothetical protein
MVLIIYSLAAWLVAVTLICLFVAGASRGRATTVQPLLTASGRRVAGGAAPSPRRPEGGPIARGVV